MANETPFNPRKAFIERAERLQREADDLADAQKELIREVKAAGFDVPSFKEALMVRRQDKLQRAEKGQLVDGWLQAAEAAQ
jgi:uncharacterized protein (UPF0335 family)